MWFRRPTNNRRVVRENVLEVRLRERGLRAARWRLVATALAIAVGTLAVLAVIWRAGQWALDEFVFRNEAFAIRRLELETDGVIPRSLLQRWAGVRPGENLMALDLTRVERDLKLVPLIANVAIQRIPPDTLRIRVSERVPLAEVRWPQLRAAGGAEMARFYLDEEGWVISFSPDWPGGLLALLGREDLPRLVGLDAAWVRPGRPVDLQVVRAALRLIDAFETSAMMSLVTLQTVDVSQSDVLEVTTAGGSRVVFGLEHPDEQLARWRLAHDHFARQGRAIQSLDLSVADNAPVVLYDAGAAVPESPKSVKPPRLKKRHV